MSRLCAYTVDRLKTNQIYKQVLKNYSVRILQEGMHSVFFPGGGRSRSGAIEGKLKLGLMGTGLEAQLRNYMEGKANPNVYVVPMALSYDFVLEAGSLIEDHLAEAGKHRYIIMDDESWQAEKVVKFFWKFFKSESHMCVRIGRPLDVFGNFVDENGRSIGPNGTTIDPMKWLTTNGRLMRSADRDHEYTRELGAKLVERYYRENVVLTPHLVAFAFFETLRMQHPELDLFRFLRLSLAQRTVPYANFLEMAETFREKVRAAADRGELYLSEELQRLDTRGWVEHGVHNLGQFHNAAVLKIQDGAMWTEDMNLLYYYRNRLSGYGLSMLAHEGQRKPGQHDRQGFLS